MNINEAEKLAMKLMQQYGLANWDFQWGFGQSLFGSCHYATQTISLSKTLTELNDENEVKDVILHEIAHAKVDPKMGHNRIWKNMCLEVGARPHRCYSAITVIRPKKKYTAYCPKCGASYEKRRKTRVSCGECSPTFNKKYLLKYRLN
jgi:predicted SprT family Zn-dependent metalloprotease